MERCSTGVVGFFINNKGINGKMAENVMMKLVVQLVDSDDDDDNDEDKGDDKRVLLHFISLSN